MTAAALTTHELADLLGVLPRTVRKWITAGMPAEKGHGNHWEIDPDAAGPWIKGNTTTTLAALEGLPGSPPARPGPGPPPAPAEDLELDEGETTRRHIRRLDSLLSAYTDILAADASTTDEDGATRAPRYDPRLIAGVKQLSTELRRLETHEADRRIREERLMDRDTHERVLGTFARVVIDELDAWARNTPDLVIDTLTQAKVKVKAKRTTRLLDAALAGAAEELRNRLAEAVARTEGIE